MIAKATFFLAVLAIVHSSIVAPGLLNAGVLAPWGVAVPSAVTTGSVVSIPGAVSTDKRVIGAWAGAPLAGGLLANGLWGGALGWGNGLIAAPGIAKAIL